MVGLGVSSGTDYSYIDLTPFFESQHTLRHILCRDGETLKHPSHDD